VPSCTCLGGHGQFSHAFRRDFYDFYSVSPEYFGYTLVGVNIFFKFPFYLPAKYILKKTGGY
jgi:hypothetical protein